MAETGADEGNSNRESIRAVNQSEEKVEWKERRVEGRDNGLSVMRKGRTTRS